MCICTFSASVGGGRFKSLPCHHLGHKRKENKTLFFSLRKKREKKAKKRRKKKEESFMVTWVRRLSLQEPESTVSGSIAS